MQLDDKRCVNVRTLLSIAKLYEGWTYTVEQGTYNEQLLMMRFKTAQKVKVKPDMATYLFNTVMYKYLITK